MFIGDEVGLTSGTFPVFPCIPEKLLLVGGACSQTGLPAPGPLLGLQSDWCVVIFPSPWNRTHFGVMLALVWAVRILPGLWHCFDGILPKAIRVGGFASLWPLIYVRVCSASFPIAFWIIYADVGVF